MKLLERLFEKVDISSLVFFRIAFGGILLWEVCRYFHYGWIKRYWIDPDFYFTFDGFHWVKPFGGEGMYLHFFLLGILALFILLGFLYRLSTFLFFIGFTYVFLLDKSNYLNHFYLISLLSFLMIFVPAHRSLSIDVRLWPGIRSETAPQWALWLLAFQVRIAYFFGGLAKINYDWVIAGEPLRRWLGQSTEFPLLGQLFTREWMIYFYAWSGMLFDLLIVPALIWRKTRWLAFGAVAFFHLSNSEMFQIGIFPWFMLAASSLFFQPDWFRRFVNFTTGNRWPAGGIATGNSIKTNLPAYRISLVTASFLGIWAFFQIVIPLRHFAIPGNPSWTEEGHRFAWHMKLRDKQAKARFIVKNPATGEEDVIKPGKYLSSRQDRKMRTRPDMILQFCHYLKKVYEEKGQPEVEVRAIVLARLNGREEQFLIDPEVNLANMQYDQVPAPWIMPLLEKQREQATLGVREESDDE